MKLFYSLIILLALTLVVGCENDKSIQNYYVENQQDSDFMALDVPASLFTNSETLEAEQKQTLESIKKINVLALKKEKDPLKFEKEKQKLNEILSDDQYQLLMKYGGEGKKAELYFIGEEDAIDELIVYGYDDNQGLGIARVLGENMNPGKIMEMMKSLDKENIDTKGIEGIMNIFRHSGKSKNSAQVKEEAPVGTLKTQQ